MTNEWTKVESDTWNPEEGDEISGVYLGYEADVGENKSNIYSIEVEEGKKSGVWGCKVLDQKMMVVKPGDLIKIKFIGRVKKEGKKEYKDYEVFTKPAVTPVAP